MGDLKDELMTVIDGAVERYRGQTGPDVRRVSMRTELFDLVASGPVLPDAFDAGAEES